MNPHPSGALDQPEHLLRLFDAIYVVMLSGWIGAIAFFSFGVAPLIFRVLEPAQAGLFVRSLFPRYYAWVASCAGLAATALLCGALSMPSLRGTAMGLQIAGGIIACFIMLYCGNVLTSAINAARDAGESGRVRFEKLHQRSVTLNSLVLLIGLVLAILFSSRSSHQMGADGLRHGDEYTRRSKEAMEQNLRMWDAQLKREFAPPPGVAPFAWKEGDPVPKIEGSIISPGAGAARVVPKGMRARGESTRVVDEREQVVERPSGPPDPAPAESVKGDRPKDK